PRVIEPLASDSTLPCSEVTSCAILSMFSSSSCLKRNMTRARISGGVLAQPGKAAAATFTAASSSLLLASATLAWTSPVAGLNTSAERPLVPATSLPPMKWLIVRMGFILGGEIAAGRAVLADGAALHRALFASYRRQ